MHHRTENRWLFRFLTLSFVVATSVFVAVAEDVVTRDTLSDTSIATWVAARETPGLTVLMTTITQSQGIAGILFLSVLFSAWLVRTRNWAWLAALVAVVPGGALFNVLVKDIFGRARPPHPGALTTYSFPSGHTLGATVFYGFLAAYLIVAVWGRGPSRYALAAAILAGAATLIALVGFSRVYLEAHYVSDVLGAVAEGIAWLTLCLNGLVVWQARHPKTRTAPG